MVACNDYDADEEGHMGRAYSTELMNDRLLLFIFMDNAWRLLTSFARLL